MNRYLAITIYNGDAWLAGSSKSGDNVGLTRHCKADSTSLTAPTPGMVC